MASALDYTVNCEDERLVKAGYIVCGSHADTVWHWRPPNGKWRDGYRSEYAAANAALHYLQSQPAPR